MQLSDFEHGGIGPDNVNSLKSDEHLTAFGLALMQNGFHAPNAILNSQTLINKQNQNQNQTNSSVNTPHGQNNAPGEPITQKGIQHANELSAWNSKSEIYQQPQKQFKYTNC